MTPFLAELIGTAILILLGNGVVAGVLLSRSKAYQSGWVVITFGWGFAVMIAAYVVGHVSGAYLNPALTIGFAFADKLSWSDALVMIPAQMIGGFLGAVLVWLHYYPHWKETEDPELKLACYSTIPAIRHPFANLLSETIATFLLVWVLLALGAKGVVFADGLKTLVVGLFIASIGMSLGGTTGYAINPARDLGPRIAHAVLPIPGKGSSDWGYSWIPVVGPILGAVLAAYAYLAIFS